MAGRAGAHDPCRSAAGSTGLCQLGLVFNWLQDFIDCIREDREPALTIEDALCVLQSIDAAYESARTGSRVEVDYAS